MHSKIKVIYVTWPKCQFLKNYQYHSFCVTLMHCLVLHFPPIIRHWFVQLIINMSENYIHSEEKNTDNFASLCSKIVIFKRPENYPKYTQNSWSFHQLIDHIREASEWVLVTKFPVVLKIWAVKVENAKKNLFYEVKMER